MRRLQEFEDAVDCDSSQVTAIGACASTEIDGYGHRMSLQIGKKKKGKAIAAEDMLKTCLIGKYLTSSICFVVQVWYSTTRQG